MSTKIKPSSHLKNVYNRTSFTKKLVKTNNNNRGAQPKKVVKTMTLQNWLS